MRASSNVGARAAVRTRRAKKTIPTTRRILVPYDFSRHADRALQLAARLVGPRGEVLVLHAMTPFMSTEGAPWGFARDVFETASRQVEERLAEVIKGQRAESVVSRVDVGEPLDRIAEAAREVDAIVMATAGRTGTLRLLIGSVAEKVVRHAPVPVLTVRPNARLARHPFGTILVPYDYSTHADRALQLAASLAGPHGRLIVLHVVPNLPDHASRLRLGPKILADDRARLERAVLRARLRKGPTIECRVESGDPYRHIARAARGVGSVVMCTTGRGGLAQLVIGSVTEKVVRHAPVPVLTFRPEARTDGMLELLGRAAPRRARRRVDGARRRTAT